MFDAGDLVIRTDGKRGIFLRKELKKESSKVYIQVSDRILLEPVDNWKLMRSGWGKSFGTEEERRKALKGT